MKDPTARVAFSVKALQKSHSPAESLGIVSRESRPKEQLAMISYSTEEAEEAMEQACSGRRGDGPGVLKS